MTKILPILLPIFSCLFSFSAQSESEVSNWTFSGFGTLGYTYDDTEQIGYIRDYSQTLDIDQTSSFQTDSQIGAQLSYRSSPYWSTMVQVVLADEVDYELSDSLEWAYLALHPISNVDIRFGRMGLDLFALSDTRRIDYAHLWARPPSEVYSWVPIYSVDGIDAAYYFETESTYWRIKAQYGKSHSKSEMSAGETVYEFEGDDLLALSLTADRNDWSFRTTLAAVTVGSDLPEQAMQLQFVLEEIEHSDIGLLPARIRELAGALSDELKIKGEQIKYAQISVQFDNYDWLLLSELTYSDADISIMPSGLGGYLTFGKRISTFTPYINYSFFKPKNEFYNEEYPWEGKAPQLTTLFQTTTFIINSGRIEQDTITLGTRWDFHQQAALNLQWDHVSIASAGSAMWAGSGGDLYQSQDVNLFSASISFVF